MMDSCIWLGSIPGYVLSDTAKGLVNMVMEDPDPVMGEGGGVTHFDRCDSPEHVTNALSVKWTSYYVAYSGGCKCNSLWPASLHSSCTADRA
jgi:hypothetical protein